MLPARGASPKLRFTNFDSNPTTSNESISGALSNSTSSLHSSTVSSSSKTPLMHDNVAHKGFSKQQEAIHEIKECAECIMDLLSSISPDNIIYINILLHKIVSKYIAIYPKQNKLSLAQLRANLEVHLIDLKAAPFIVRICLLQEFPDNRADELNICILEINKNFTEYTDEKSRLFRFNQAFTVLTACMGKEQVEVIVKATLDYLKAFIKFPQLANDYGQIFDLLDRINVDNFNEYQKAIEAYQGKILEHKFERVIPNIPETKKSASIEKQIEDLRELADKSCDEAIRYKEINDYSNARAHIQKAMDYSRECLGLVAVDKDMYQDLLQEFLVIKKAYAHLHTLDLSVNSDVSVRLYAELRALALRITDSKIQKEFIADMWRAEAIVYLDAAAATNSTDYLIEAEESLIHAFKSIANIPAGQRDDNNKGFLAEICKNLAKINAKLFIAYRLKDFRDKSVGYYLDALKCLKMMSATSAETAKMKAKIYSRLFENHKAVLNHICVNLELNADAAIHPSLELHYHARVLSQLCNVFALIMKNCFEVINESLVKECNTLQSNLDQFSYDSSYVEFLLKTKKLLIYLVENAVAKLEDITPAFIHDFSIYLKEINETFTLSNRALADELSSYTLLFRKNESLKSELGYAESQEFLLTTISYIIVNINEHTKQTLHTTYGVPLIFFDVFISEQVSSEQAELGNVYEIVNGTLEPFWPQIEKGLRDFLARVPSITKNQGSFFNSEALSVEPIEQHIKKLRRSSED